jgi:hypothetical protein
MVESFRGFRLEALKKLENPREMVKYALQHLPRLGRGSSRDVFGLGSGKVLKINTGSYQQNETEMDVYTKPGMANFLAKIYDYDPEKFLWIIAEGVQVIADNAQLLQKFTPSEILVRELVTGAYKNKPFEEALLVAIETHNAEYDQGFGTFHTDRKLSLKDFSKYDIELFQKMHEVTRLGMDDIDRYDHWGMTSDGRIVVVDYGFEAL